MAISLRFATISLRIGLSGGLGAIGSGMQMVLTDIGFGNHCSRSQALPDNAPPAGSACRPVICARQSLAAVRSQAEPGNEVREVRVIFLMVAYWFWKCGIIAPGPRHRTGRSIYFLFFGGAILK
jgi:hypothetical protein